MAMTRQARANAADEPDHLVANPENLAKYDSRMRLSLFAIAIMINERMIDNMTIELTDDELQEIVKALETVRRLHDARELPVHNLTKLIEQFRLHLPGSGVMLRPKSKASGDQGG
jgi:hypothetical protein